MNSNVTVELVGGEWDGRIITVHESMIKSRYLVLPSEPELALAFLPDPLSEVVSTFQTQNWEWDGTYTRNGAFRFRRAA